MATTTSRFHIVKIDTGPQKRGRWTCLDSEVEQTHELNAVIVGGPAAEQPVVNFEGALAIDNKIEQAMDLVKTHLRYAVRGEVEVMKQRIQDLEKYVESLEKENKLLRECVPPEILAQITTTATTTLASASTTTTPAAAAAAAATSAMAAAASTAAASVLAQSSLTNGGAASTSTQTQPVQQTAAATDKQPTAAANLQPQAPPT